MKTLNDELAHLFKSARAMALNGVLKKATEEKLANRLFAGGNSLGFLLRHIAETELFFAQTAFMENIQFDFQTFGPKADKGQFDSDLPALLALLEESQKRFLHGIAQTPLERWDIPVQTIIGEFPLKDVVAKTAAHSASHGGQAVLCLKYGQVFEG